MPIRRRLVLATAALLPAAAAFGQTPAPAVSDDPRMSERSLGPATAPVTVVEWFSLTCTHCAAFQKTTFPDVKAKLIDTGRIRYVWRDFPLDQVALTAAMVARALPPERYEPFVTALLLTQIRWVFTRGVNPTEELAKLAALAGMSRATFDATVADDALKQAILTTQSEVGEKAGVNSTPSFFINGKMISGEIKYADFEKAVTAAAG